MSAARTVVPPLVLSQRVGGLGKLIVLLSVDMQDFLKASYAPRITAPGAALEMPDLGDFGFEAAVSGLQRVRSITRCIQNLEVELVPEIGDDPAHLPERSLSARLLCAMAQAWKPGDEPYFSRLQVLSVKAEHPAFIQLQFLRPLVGFKLRSFELDLSLVQGPARTEDLPSVSTITWLQTSLSRCTSLESVTIRLPRAWATFTRAGEPIWEEERAFVLLVHPLLARAISAKHAVVSNWTMHTKATLTAFANCLSSSLRRLVLAPEPEDSLLELEHDVIVWDPDATPPNHLVEFARVTVFKLLLARPCQAGSLLRVTTWPQLFSFELILRPHFHDERFEMRDVAWDFLVEGAPNLQRLVIGVDQVRLKPNPEHPEQTTNLWLGCLSSLRELGKMREFGIHLGSANNRSGSADDVTPAVLIPINSILALIEDWPKLRQFRTDPPRPGHSCFDFSSADALVSLRMHCPVLEAVTLRLDPASLPLEQPKPSFPDRKSKRPLILELELPAGTLIDQERHINDVVHRFVVEVWGEGNVQHSDYTSTTVVEEGGRAPPTWYSDALSEAARPGTARRVRLVRDDPEARPTRTGRWIGFPPGGYVRRVSG